MQIIIKRWHDLSLNIKGLMVVALPLAILMISLALLYAHETKTNQLENKLTVALKNQRDLQTIHTQLTQSSNSVRDYLLTGERDLLQQYYQSSVKILPILKPLSQGENDPKIQHKLQQLETKIRKNLFELNAIINTDLDLDQLKLANQFEQQSNNLNLINYLLGEITDAKSMIATQEQNEINIERQANLRLTLIAALAGALGTLFGAWVYANEIVKRVGLVRDNAKRLARGETLQPHPETNDELGELFKELDQSAQKIEQTKQALLLATQASEQANNEKSRFLSRTSHELRTPLNAILGFAQLLEADLAQSNQKQAAIQIKNAGNHLLKLINEVLEIARIESGEFLVSLQPVNLSELLNEAVHYIKPLGSVRDIDIVCNYDATLWVMADQQRLMQVILNLLSNAFKYGPFNSTVYLSAIVSNDLVKIDVLDEGNGIPTDLKQRLFTPFDRLGAEQSKIEGTGLGLALSKQMMTAMGGNIGVDDNKSLFWLTISALEKPQNQQTNPYLNSPNSNQPLTNTKFTILHVEDNASNRALIEAIISRNHNLRLYCVETIRAAKQMLTDLKPHLILLDLNLPDGNGQQLITYLRDSQRYANLPILVLSADASPEAIETATKLGATDYLIKPINVAQFNLKLKAYLH